MSIDFAIDKDGKFLRENKGFRMTKNKSEYVAQKIQIKMKTFLGEWYLDTTKGIPYLTEMLEKNIDMGFVESIFKSKFYEVKEVQELIYFRISIDSSTRKLNLKWSVRIKSGDIVEGVL